MQFLREAASHDGLSGCLTWPFHRNAKGYAGRVDWEGGRDKAASRVLCELVHGPAPSPRHQAAHSCGRGHLGCVSGGHVRWATPKENNADKFHHGTMVRGERIYCAKLTSADVRQLRGAHGAGLNQVALAQRFGITPGTVWRILHGKTWKHELHSLCGESRSP